MTNNEIADHFSLLSKLMDIHGENSFKSKSYSILAYNIEKLPAEITTMNDAELFGMKGIGESSGSKIKELIATNQLQALEDILAKTPPGILEMMRIKGLGPKKIAVIWKEMGIETIGELEYACNENRLAQTKGFGTKTQDSVLGNIKYYTASLGFHLWAHVEAVGNSLVEQLQKNNPANKFSLTGDIRRQENTLEVIEIVSDIDSDTLAKQFQSIPDTTIEEEPNERLVVRIPNEPVVRFHLTEAAGYFTKLFMTTGSAEFMEAFLAKYLVAENAASEETIFTDNKLAYIPPAQRETANILELAATGSISEVIQPSDIKGIIHSHSTWSDGQDTIEQMAKACIEQRFEYLVISDHSQAAYYASGLTPDRIVAQHAEIDALNAKLAPFKIFKSIEVDILSNGDLDYNAGVLSSLDIVIASVHSNLKMSMEKAMDRVMAAIRNPFTTILGHPTGRLLLSREGYPLDHKAIIDACAEHNVVIEINAHPKRLDLDWRWVEYAMERGVLLSIDPDAHSVKGYKDVYYGVMSAQKAGLTAKQNLSSYSLAEMETFLKAYEEKRSKVMA